MYSFLFRGQTLDDILRAENERLTDERNALQMNIRQLEQKLLGIQESTVTADEATEPVSVAPLMLFRLEYSIFES